MGSQPQILGAPLQTLGEVQTLGAQLQTLGGCTPPPPVDQVCIFWYKVFCVNISCTNKLDYVCLQILYETERTYFYMVI